MRYRLSLLRQGLLEPVISTDSLTDAHHVARFLHDRGRTVRLDDTMNPERGNLFHT